MHVCFFLLSLLSSFLNPVAHFSHILQRKVEVLGIVNCSSRLENRRGNGFCTSESPCRQETWVVLLKLVVELLVPHRPRSLVLRVWPLILANKDKNNELKCILWVCYLHVPYKIKDTSRNQLTGFFLRSWDSFCLLCGENGSRIHLLVNQL